MRLFIQKQQVQKTTKAKGSQHKIPQVEKAADANYRKEANEEKIGDVICLRTWLILFHVFVYSLGVRSRDHRYASPNAFLNHH